VTPKGPTGDKHRPASIPAADLERREKMKYEVKNESTSIFNRIFIETGINTAQTILAKNNSNY
jgi:hypothetical protein